MAKSSPPALVLAALVILGVALEARSRLADPPYDDRDAFSRRVEAGVVVPDDITLPSVPGGAPFDASKPTAPVFVSTTGIRLPLSDHTFPLPGPGDDRIILPVARALEWTVENFWKGGEMLPTATLFIDRDVPYSVITKVMWTAGQSSLHIRYVARHGDELVVFEPAEGPYWPPFFRVKITADGFVVSARAVQERLAGHDFDKLGAMAWRKKAALPEEQYALVTATPDTRYEDVLRAEDAVRPAFPFARWGIEPPHIDELTLGQLSRLSQ